MLTLVASIYILGRFVYFAPYRNLAKGRRLISVNYLYERLVYLGLRQVILYFLHGSSIYFVARIVLRKNELQTSY
jgi:hypothetical protein